MRPPRDALEAVRSRIADILAMLDSAADPDPVPDADYSIEHALPIMLYWNWSKGYSGDPDTPDDPPHLEDVTVMLGEHDITDLLSPEQLADVREAMLRDMEAGQ